MEEPVTIIDREVLKVLSTETRMNIIKELSQGSRTPSDLGKILNKSDATIVEHLEILCKADLVKKVEQLGKKWVFYTLTERGKGIISSKSRKLVIILATSILALIGSFISFAQYSVQSGLYVMRTGAENLGAGTNAIVTMIQAPYLFYLSVALLAISIIGFTVYVLKKSKIKGELT